jgi:hypothetical protein
MDTNVTGKTIGLEPRHADRTGSVDLRTAKLNRRDATDAEEPIRNQLEADSRWRLQVAGCRSIPHPRRQLQLVACNLQPATFPQTICIERVSCASFNGASALRTGHSLLVH